jgi:hypothetical protein
MITFLPYEDIIKSIECLDWQRLNTMRRESKAIYKACELVANDNNHYFANQPVVRMWYGYLDTLMFYRHYTNKHWVDRGYVSNQEDVLSLSYNYDKQPSLPNWVAYVLENEDSSFLNVYDSHQHVLARKAMEHEERKKDIALEYDYRILFNLWDYDKLKQSGYVWPITDIYYKTFKDRIDSLETVLWF